MTVMEQHIIDGLNQYCQCKGIRKSVFLKHINAGLKSVDELEKITGAGTGQASCGED